MNRPYIIKRYLIFFCFEIFRIYIPKKLFIVYEFTPLPLRVHSLFFLRLV